MSREVSALMKGILLFIITTFTPVHALQINEHQISTDPGWELSPVLRSYAQGYQIKFVKLLTPVSP